MTRIDFDALIAGWRGPALAALIAVLAGLPGLLLAPVLDRQEARFAQGSAQMIESGDLALMRFQAEDRPQAAPGAAWLQSVTANDLNGVASRDIWRYRLPSLLGAALAAWACAWGAIALFGQRAGTLAGLMMGTGFLASSAAGFATPDTLFTGSICLAMAALARLYLDGRADRRSPRLFKLAFWTGVGLSLLFNGFGGALIALTVLIVLGLWDRRWRWMRRLGWGWGLPLAALIAGPWAIAATVATDGEIWTRMLADTPLGHVARGQVGWPGYQLILAPLLMFPFTLMLPAAAMTAITRRAEPGVRFAIAWLVPGWVALELLPEQEWSHALPLYGAVVWLAAGALTRPLGRPSRLAGTALALFGGLYVTVASLFLLSEFGGAGVQAWATPTIGLTLVAGAVGGFLLYHRQTLPALMLSLTLGVLAHSTLAGVASNLRPLWVSSRLNDALVETGLHPRLAKHPGPVAIAGYAEPSAVFLIGTGTELTDGAGAAAALAQGRPAVVDRTAEQDFLASAAGYGAAPEAAATVEGYNYSTGEPLVLTLYEPATATVPAVEPAP